MRFSPNDYVMVSPHAIDAFRERCKQRRKRTWQQVRSTIVWAIYNGVQVGAQLGRNVFVQKDYDDMRNLVFVLKDTGERSSHGGRLYVVKTVLTTDQAKANMQRFVPRYEAALR